MQVISAVDESVDATRCGGTQDCHDDNRCLTHYLWEELSEQISVFLSGISLADLVQKNANKQAQQKQDNILVQMQIQ